MTLPFNEFRLILLQLKPKVLSPKLLSREQNTPFNWDRGKLYLFFFYADAPFWKYRHVTQFNEFFLPNSSVGNRTPLFNWDRGKLYFFFFYADAPFWKYRHVTQFNEFFLPNSSVGNRTRLFNWDRGKLYFLFFYADAPFGNTVTSPSLTSSLSQTPLLETELPSAGERSFTSSHPQDREITPSSDVPVVHINIPVLPD
ncbi:hypothetical protein P9112_011936 [Eukaryota sp. TZLM1-RC]